MSVIPITCDNCGAKYKLPPTFKGTQAKCQKCGSVIDVQKQREAASAGDSPAAAAKPAQARPASGAKPAVDRSKRRASATTTSKPARASDSRSRRGAKDDEDGDSPRRGREQKKDNKPMIFAGLGLVIVVIVVAIMMSGGDEKKPTEEASTNATDANANKADTNTAGTKDAAGSPEATKPADETAADETKPAGDGAKAPNEAATDAAAKSPDASASGAAAEVETPPAPPIEPAIPGAKKEPWMKQRNPPQTMSQVKSAAEMYGEVLWPDSIDATEKAEIMEIVDDLDVSGGIRSIRAKAKLVKAGYGGLFGILEALQKLDYRQASDAAFGFELNKALEDITGGLNARYAAVQADEQLHPAKALWNTKTVKAWMATFAKWPDAAAFKKAKTARAKKKRG